MLIVCLVIQIQFSKVSFNDYSYFGRHLFRRDVLEGTLDEMLYKNIKSEGNNTISGRARRESEVPDIPARLISKK